MANMYYCRFENTHEELWDCIFALEEYKLKSDSEKIYAERMRKACERYIRKYDEWLETHEDEEEEDDD